PDITEPPALRTPVDATLRSSAPLRSTSCRLPLMISVIVPIRDEEPLVAERFRRFVVPGECELLIADAGGNPETARAFESIGAQGLFCRRETYERSGGFRDLPVCDDVDMVRRWKRLGRLAVLREKTLTSARRYRAGAFSRVLRNWRVLAGYYAGVSPARLERWYNR